MEKINHKEKYINGLARTLVVKNDASEYGKELAKSGVNRIYFIACGAPNRIMASIKYWMDKYSQTLETYLYYPAEFIRQAPIKVDENSKVILISDSGKTQEILEVVDFIRSHYRCEIISITTSAKNRLAALSDVTFAYGHSEVGFEAKFIVLLAMISALMQERGEWDIHDKVMSALDALPGAMADAEEQEEEQNAFFAELYKNENFYFVTGSGPCYPVTYSLGVCVMMEALWVKIFEGEAVEFFHGPFEIIDRSIPVIVFVGEDPSRPLAERVVRFLETHTEKRLIYDSRNYLMPGVPAEVRSIVAPYILGAASIRYAEHLSRLRDQPLTTRRYMGKGSY